MGVGGLVHSDKHNDALYVCGCVFLCLGDYQWLGVWCVWLGDCFWVSLCVCLSVCFCNYVCVFTLSPLACVINVLLYIASQKQVSAPSACACICLYVFLLVGVIFLSCLSQCLFVFVSCCLSLYVSTGHQNPSPNIDICLERWEKVCGIWSSRKLIWHNALQFMCWCFVEACFPVTGVCVFVRWGGQSVEESAGGRWSTDWGSPAEGLWD